MKKLLAALVLVLVPFLAQADTQPTIITPVCGVAANGSTTAQLFSVGSLSVAITKNPQTGSSYAYPAANACGAATTRSNSGSAMADAIPGAATFGVGWMWLANADSSASDTLSGGFSGVLQPGQNLLIVSDATAWVQAGGSFYPSVSQARANLGLGSAAVVNTPISVANGGTGTGASGAIAANNIGALAEANNLSDLASASTARSNLGLGTAATQNTGTSGATVPLNNGGFTQSGTANFTGTFQSNGTAQTFPGSGSIAGTSDTQTLTNKTISGASNTLSNVPFTAMTGQAALAQLPSLPAYGIYCNNLSSLAIPYSCGAPVLHSSDPTFGAVGNGSADDTAAIQAWITACGAQHIVCLMDKPSSCYKISAALVVSAAGEYVVGASQIGSRICPSNATQDGIQVTASNVTLANFSVIPSVAQSAGSCVHVGSAGAINLVTVNGVVGSGFNCFNAIFMDQVNLFLVTNNSVSASNYAIETGYGGDSDITHNGGINGEAAGIAFIANLANAGGLRIIDNKLNTGVSGTQAILLQPSVVGSIADLIIGHNSIEGYVNGITLNKGSITSFANVIVDSNEISATNNCVQSDSNIGWLINLQITEGSCSWASGTGVSIGASTTDFDIKNVNFNGNASASNTAWTIASSAANGDVEGNHVYNLTTAAYFTNASTSTRIVDNNGMAFASLPSAAQVGSQIYVKDATAGTSTCNGSGTGTMAFRVNSGAPAWRCF